MLHMAPDYELELLRVVTEGLKDIRDEIAGLREEIALVVQRHIELDADCKLCRTVINTRISALEEYKRSHQQSLEKKVENRWSLTTKITVAVISLAGMFLATLLEHWVNK